MRSFFRQTDAVTSIEYALIASLIALAVIAGVTLAGNALAAVWGLIGECVASLGSNCG